MSTNNQKEERGALTDQDKRDIAKYMAEELRNDFYQGLGRGVFKKLVTLAIVGLIVLGIWSGMIKVPH